MTLKPKQGWFLAFTAVFAVLAGFVFWGTWSLDMVPVMPDCPTVFPVDSVTDWIRGWRQDGKFVPADLLRLQGAPYFWVELQYVLATYCAALGLVYFLRGRGLSRPAAYGAGLFLAFCGYWLTLFSAGHLGWFQWMTYGVFPFGLIDRALEKGKWRHWILLGACLAWGSFYQPDLWLLFTVFTFAYFVFRWMCTARAAGAFFPLRWVKGAGLTLAVFLAIGLPSFRNAISTDLANRDKQIDEGQTLPDGGADSDDKRWEFVTNWSLPPEDTTEFFNARVRGDTSCPLTLAIGEARGTGVTPYTGRLGRPRSMENDPDCKANYRQHSVYVGWVTCLLALLGLASPLVFRFVRHPDWRTPDRPVFGLVIFFSVSAVVFWLFSLGRFCEPVYRCVYRLPMGDYLRAPVKWHHLTEFCLVVLAGFGLEFIRRLLVLTKGARAAVIACTAVVLVGSVDLARNARLFCAPHRAGCQIVPAQLYQNQPFSSDPSRRRAFEEGAAKSGFAVLGWESLALPVAADRKPNDVVRVDMPYLMPRKGLKGTCGTMKQTLASGDELHVPLVDFKPDAVPPRPAGGELSGIAACLAWLSAAATVGVLLLLCAVANRRPFVEARLK